MMVLVACEESQEVTKAFRTARALGMAVYFDGKQAIEEELI